jgi:hypothetical protein
MRAEKMSPKFALLSFAVLPALLALSCSGPARQPAPPYPLAQPEWKRDIRSRLAGTVVNCSFDNVPLKEVLDSLQKQSGVNFVVDPRAVKEAPLDSARVSFSATDATLGSALNAAVRGTGLDYTLRNEVVFISLPSLLPAFSDAEAAVSRIEVARERMRQMQANRDIEAKLDTMKVSLNFDSTEAGDFVTFFGGFIGTEVNVAPCEPGVDMARKLTLKVKEVSARSALGLFCQFTEVDFILDGRITITSRQSAEEFRQRQAEGDEVLRRLVAVDISPRPVWSALAEVEKALGVPVFVDEAVWNCPEDFGIKGEALTAREVLRALAETCGAEFIADGREVFVLKP